MHIYIDIYIYISSGAGRHTTTTPPQLRVGARGLNYTAVIRIAPHTMMVDI